MPLHNGQYVTMDELRAIREAAAEQPAAEEANGPDEFSVPQVARRNRTSEAQLQASFGLGPEALKDTVNTGNKVSPEEAASDPVDPEKAQANADAAAAVDLETVEDGEPAPAGTGDDQPEAGEADA